jgi:hypothetical protein
MGTLTRRLRSLIVVQYDTQSQRFGTLLSLIAMRDQKSAHKPTSKIVQTNYIFNKLAGERQFKKNDHYPCLFRHGFT